MTEVSADSQSVVIAQTNDWLRRVVVALNLCPFAANVLGSDALQIIVSGAHDPDALVADLDAALLSLDAADALALETTLLVIPGILQTFGAFNDFLDIADALLEARGLTGRIQIASFHPHYQFADASSDDIGNYTNRSPWPTLHLLRESSVSRAVASHPDVERIPSDNQRRLEALTEDERRTILGIN